MITIDFSKRGDAGLCDFLSSSIRSQISAGLLKADEKLPSKRALASHLGVSVITVQNAYEQLIDEGYIYSIEKKGFFVTEIAPDGAPGDYVATAPSNARIKPAMPPARAGKKFFFDFRSNTPNLERFPFSQWAHVMRRVLKSGDEKLLQRQDVNGVYELRAAIARHLSGFRNMSIQPEQIVIGAGTESLYSMLVQFFGRNKIYGVENPGYHKVASVFHLNGAQVKPVLIDSLGLDTSLLNQKKIDIIHLSPAHHFPTGRVMPIRRRLELLQWASEAPDRFIIEDDYDSEFRFNGKPLPTLFSGDSSGKVIYVNTFSKTISPSFRISYMVLPVRIAEAFHEKLGFYSCPVSAFEQYTLADFINDGFYANHLIRMKNYYRNLRNTFIYALSHSAFKDLIEIAEEEAGLHFLLSFKSGDGAGDRDLKAAFAKEGLNLPLLKEFYYEDAGEGAVVLEGGTSTSQTFVINYSALEKEKIPAIVQRMEKALQ